MESNRQKSSKNETDSFYAKYLALRSVPLATFLAGGPQKWALPITSIPENKLLRELGLSSQERDQIEGLFVRRPSSAGFVVPPGHDHQQLSARAIVRLAADPPGAVGIMQQRTTRWLLRPFPLGLRFSGKNMSPLPCWLAG